MTLFEAGQLLLPEEAPWLGMFIHLVAVPATRNNAGCVPCDHRY